MSTTENIKFIEFWRFIAEQLGDSQCLLNLRANRIKDLFSNESNHRAFLKDVISLSYERCQCKHLKDKLDINIVLDVLGETAHLLQGAQADDLLDIELLEEICWLACQRYPKHIHIPTLPALEKSKIDYNNAPERAAVISLPNVKIRIANQQI